MPPEQVVGMARNGWTASIGITGRHGPDYAILKAFADLATQVLQEDKAKSATALASVRDLEDPVEKTRAIIEAVSQLVDQKNLSGLREALSLAQSIVSPSQQAEALVTVVGAMAQVRDVEGVRRVVEIALAIERSDVRDRLLEATTSTYMILGEVEKAQEVSVLRNERFAQPVVSLTHQSIVRIIRTNDSTAGTGFVLTDDGFIATCASVVRAADGAPGHDINLVFHTTGLKTRAMVLPEYWREEEDVAILHARESIPEGVQPLPLGSSRDCDGHIFRTLGFTSNSEHGLWGAGEIVGKTISVDGRQLLQLSSDAIAPGFAGAPVWDQEIGRVVGMISLLDTSDRFALAIPAEMLQDARLSARERANITPRASTTEIITDVAHTLPFDKLSPRDFERLCLWLVEREGYERAELLGAAGSEQGRDIVAWREGRLWAFQCKRVKHFGSKSAFLEVDMVLSLSKDRPPAGLIFLVTCDVSDSTRQQVRQRCAGEIECHFWGRTELDEKIRRHADIVEEFFSPRIHLSGSPFQAPPLPLHFVPRSEISEALKARLLTDESSAPGVLVVSSIHGLGGIGKSTLAAALAHDRETQVRFPDGVLWAPLGQRPEILSALESWIRALGDYDFHPATVNAASAHLRSLLYGRAAMLVVDDVRQADHARPFLVGGARCRVLVTTRDALVAQALSGMVYHLDVMTPEQSLDLLSARLGRTLDDVEREEALKLAKAVGYLPLALELAAAQVASGMHWAELRRTLENEMKQPQAQTPSSGDQPHVYSKEMVRVPAGLFLYGNDKRRVDVHEFWIDKALVTNAEYARFVAATGHKPPSHWRGKVPLQELAEHPVIQVSWHDAVAYGEWAGKRLPTEEEWEKAARGTDGRIYPWGDEPPDEGRCNFGGNVGSTTPVGRYSPQGDSPYGCSDMAGNVWEWTASDYDAGRKVLRGGSWDNEPLHVRAAYRIANTPGSRGNVMGFRCVRSSE